MNAKISKGVNYGRVMANFFSNIYCNKNNEFKGTRLQQLRINAGFKTSVSFAKAAKLDINTWSRIETGNQLVSETQKEKIAKALKMEIEKAFPIRVHTVKINTTYKPLDQLEKELYAQFGDKLYTMKG